MYMLFFLLDCIAKSKIFCFNTSSNIHSHRLKPKNKKLKRPRSALNVLNKKNNIKYQILSNTQRTYRSLVNLEEKSKNNKNIIPILQLN